MNKIIPLKDYKEMPFVRFGAFATRVATEMRKHQIFKDGIPNLDLLDASLLLYMPMSSILRLGDIESTQRKKLFDDIVSILNKLNALVDFVADGDKEIILMAGFNPSKGENTPTPHVEQISNLTVEYTNTEGVYKVKMKRQNQAFEYVFKWVFENPAGLDVVFWNMFSTDKSSFEINVGRTSGNIWFMIEINGRKGDTIQTAIFSKPISKLGL